MSDLRLLPFTPKPHGPLSVRPDLQPLADKLAILADLRPASLRTIESIVDKILDRLADRGERKGGA